jgi:hypothetical protein
MSHTRRKIKHMKRTLLTTVGVLARLVVFWMTGVPATDPAHQYLIQTGSNLQLI